MTSEKSCETASLSFYTHIRPINPELAEALAPFPLKYGEFYVGGFSGLAPEINLLIGLAQATSPLAPALLTNAVWDLMKVALSRAWAVGKRMRGSDGQAGRYPVLRLRASLEGSGTVRFEIQAADAAELERALDAMLPLIQQLTVAGWAQWHQKAWVYYEDPS